MARRRSYLSRPHEALAAAAACHARHAAGELHPSDDPEQAAAAKEPSAQSKRASEQRREEGGKFG